MAGKTPSAEMTEKVRAALTGTDPKKYAWANKLASQWGWTRDFSQEPLSQIKSVAKSVPSAAGTWASRLAAGVRSAGSAAAAKRAAMGAVAGNAISAVGTRIAAIGAGAGAAAASTSAATVGAVAVAGMALVGGAVYGGHVYANGTIKGNEKKYVDGNEKMAATHANYAAKLARKKSSGRSSEQLTAYNPGNSAEEHELIDQAAGTAVNKAPDAITAAKNIVDNSNSPAAAFDGSTTGSPAGAVAATVDPNKPAAAANLINSANRTLSPNNIHVPTVGGDVTPAPPAPAKPAKEKKEGIKNVKQKTMAGSLFAVAGGALGGVLMPTALSGLGIGLLAGPIGGVILGATIAFVIGWKLWGYEND